MLLMTQLSTNCLKISDKPKAMVQNYECKYCKTKFHKEQTLFTHLCVKKRRAAEIDSPESRFGLRAFQRFYQITMGAKKPKSVQEFIDSPYYIDFVKFGNHLAMLKPVYPEQFIEFVITNSIKLKDWSKDIVYSTYIRELLKKEPAETATDRSITEIMEWCGKRNVDFKRFFYVVSANEVSQMVSTGKISPWVLYLCESGGYIMDQFNEDHVKIIGDIIDPSFWTKKFKANDSDVEYIKTLLEQVGL